MGISAFSTLSNVSATTRLALGSVMPGLFWSRPVSSTADKLATQAAAAGSATHLVHAANAANAANAYCKAIPSLRASHPLAGNAVRARNRRLLSLGKSSPQAIASGPTSGLDGATVVVSRLRVLREFEPGKHPAAAGRMVISGRMVDVCAELDRLVGAESAH